jgi:RimJ/RimL family protein N-acetyltransferase
VIEGEGLRLRRAESRDVDFIVELLSSEEVEPFLAAVAARTREEVLAEVERSRAEPDAFGRFVVEVAEDGEWQRAGLMGFQLRNRRSRIAFLERLAVHPDFRGRRLADRAARLFQRHLVFDLGFHRLELEIYGFNERAIRHAERSGFLLEGRKRRAYLRHGEWVDGVLFGLTREDLE